MLIPEIKKVSLDRNRIITLAALDYHLAKHAGTFVCDGIDSIADYYKEQKLQTEKYYKQRQFNKLQQKFIKFTENLITEAVPFSIHLKQTTGYEIDLVADLRNRIEAIILQNKVRNQKDYQDVCKMLNFYHQTGVEDESVLVLRKLIELPIITVKQRSSGKDLFIENSYSEATSPDGLKKIRVEKSGKLDNAVTYIIIFLNGVSSSFLCVKGHHPYLKASFESDCSIVVETSNDYIFLQKTEKVESRNEIITIEYIER